MFSEQAWCQTEYVKSQNHISFFLTNMSNKSYIYPSSKARVDVWRVDFSLFITQKRQINENFKNNLANNRLYKFLIDADECKP